MIDATAVQAILDQYAKHGWELRRVLLSEEAKAELDTMFAGRDVRTAEIDGLWFVRRSRPGSESWELRRLGGSPFALVAVIDEGASDEERESSLSDKEQQMKEAAERIG